MQSHLSLIGVDEDLDPVTSFRTQSLFCSFLVSLRGLNLVRELVTCYYLSWWLLSSVEIRSDH